MVVRIKKELAEKFETPRDVNKALGGVLEVRDMFDLTDSDKTIIKSIGSLNIDFRNHFYKELLEQLEPKGVTADNIIVLSKIL